jgi:hypothetical protein
MATLLEQYLKKQADYNSQMAENSFPPDEAIVMQELNYRICILETFRSFCRTAPLTTDVKVLGYHYQLVNAYVRFLLNERKFGPKTDEAGQKKRETAYVSLERVVQNGAKQFSSFTASSQDQYKKTISGMINTILPVWIQYRNTYINF